MAVSDAVIRVAIDFFEKNTLLLLRIKVLYCLPQGIDMIHVYSCKRIMMRVYDYCLLILALVRVTTGRRWQ